MSTDGVIGASWLPTDGYLDPSQLTYALADGARRGGATIRTHTRVTGIDVRDGAVRGVSAPIAATSSARSLVNAGGMYAAEIGRMAGVRVPVVPMAHEYLVTQPFRERGDGHLPTLRDPDHLVYFREEGGGLVMGGYERESAPWALAGGRPRPGRDPARLQRPPAGGGLGPLRGDRRQLPHARAGDGGRAGDAADQRARGVHARRRVLPRRDRGAGAVRGRGFCAHGLAGAGGVGKAMAEWIDGRRAVDRLCGTWTSAASAATTARRGTRSRASARCTRPTTTSSTRTTSAARGGRCARRRPTTGTASTAPRSARSPAGSG